MKWGREIWDTKILIYLRGIDNSDDDCTSYYDNYEPRAQTLIIIFLLFNVQRFIYIYIISIVIESLY